MEGPSHAQGGIPLIAEGGEFILRKSAVDRLGLPFLEYLNEEGDLPFMRFGEGGALDQNSEVGISEIDTNDGELKSLIKELIQAIKDGDKTITEAIEELDVTPEVSVYNDLEGQIRSELYEYDSKLREADKRKMKPRR